MKQDMVDVQSSASDALERLVDLLQVKPIGSDLFRGHSESIGTPAAIGGRCWGRH